MKITLDIPDTCIFGFLNVVELKGSSMQMESFQLGSDDLVDGKTTCLYYNDDPDCENCDPMDI